MNIILHVTKGFPFIIFVGVYPFEVVQAQIAGMRFGIIRDLFVNCQEYSVLSG
jgi:hypothetical protein